MIEDNSKIPTESHNEDMIIDLTNCYCQCMHSTCSRVYEAVGRPSIHAVMRPPHAAAAGLML